MTVTQDTTCTAADVLAEMLGLDLPEPAFAALFLDGENSRQLPRVSLQFHGPDEIPSVHSWADRFGVAVNAVSNKDETTTHEARFSRLGVWICAYCRVASSRKNSAQETGK